MLSMSPRDWHQPDAGNFNSIEISEAFLKLYRKPLSTFVWSTFCLSRLSRMGLPNQRQPIGDMSGVIENLLPAPTLFPPIAISGVSQGCTQS